MESYSQYSHASEEGKEENICNKARERKKKEMETAAIITFSPAQM